MDMLMDDEELYLLYIESYFRLQISLFAYQSHTIFILNALRRFKEK